MKKVLLGLFAVTVCASPSSAQPPVLDDNPYAACLAPKRGESSAAYRERNAQRLAEIRAAEAAERVRTTTSAQPITAIRLDFSALAAGAGSQ